MTTINKLKEIITHLQTANNRSNAHVSIGLVPEAVAAIVGVIEELQGRLSLLESSNSFLLADIGRLQAEVQSLRHVPQALSIIPVADTTAEDASTETKTRRGRPPKKVD